MSAPAATFELLGPLPRRVTAIEASAGTGKTFTLAGLAVRELVEEGVGIGELLMVTFTRAAAAELRDRVRQRVVDAEAALASGVAPPSDDVLAQLIDVGPAERDRRLARARAAVSGFDAATITTIHGFASQVLAALGAAAPGDPDATLVDDVLELAHQVTADVLARAALVLADPDAADDGSTLTRLLRQVRLGDVPDLRKLLPFARPPARQPLAATVIKVLGNPGIAIVPPADPAVAGTVAAVRRALVDEVVAGVRRRRRQLATLSYDEVLTQVRDALLVDDDGAARARLALRRRFRVALIDEFQDTDPVQWDIFRALFAAPGELGSLVLVGDPKQAIYAFRGANVHTYLAAATGDGVQRATLGTNWRSDGALLAGLGALLDGITFGHEEIAFLPVDPASRQRDRRATDLEGQPLPAVVVRSVTGDGVPRATSGPTKGKLSAERARQLIADDLAEQVRRLLEHALLPDDEHGGHRPARPDDIAVLVRSHSHAAPVKAALDRHGIPAVVNRAGSVTASPAAAQLRLLLHAVAHPASVGTARAVALSWFFDWSGAQLDGATDDDLAELHATLHGWAERLAHVSFATFAATVVAATGAVARRLTTPDGDRDVTDLDHLVELLHTATAGRPTSASTVLAVLDALTEDGDELQREVIERRVESDARAVQILTTHASKGLEFPIVCCPSLHEVGLVPKGGDRIYVDPDTRVRTIDVAYDTGWADHLSAEQRKDLANEDHHGEGLRLAYVALTRARHLVLTWWATTTTSPGSPLARLLFARDATGAVDPLALRAERIATPADPDVAARLAGLDQASGGALRVEVVEGTPVPPATPWTPGATEVVALAHDVARLRRLDRSRRRWSFTAISATDDRRAHLEVVTDPLDDVGGDRGAGDEQTTGPPRPDLADLDRADVDRAAAGSTDPAPSLPLAQVPGSAELGTLVHSVLERIDFTAPDLAAEVRSALVTLTAAAGAPLDLDALATGLVAAIESPLGPLLGGRRLRDVTLADRLDELAFDLRLGGDGSAPARADQVGRLLLDHLPADDPLRPWAADVAAGCFPVPLAGHLTGSIDAVLRLPGPDPGHPHRYAVVDYKTNTLWRPGQLPSVADYHPDRLPAAMAAHHYPLQALLYLVALHRFLRWRLPTYDPPAHLAGAGYLFVRGMVGPNTPRAGDRPAGVFAWDVPAPLVVALSDLLAGAGGRS